MKKILLFILLLNITSCANVKEQTKGLGKIGDVCPPQGERALSDIFCKEPK